MKAMPTSKPEIAIVNANGSQPINKGNESAMPNKNGPTGSVCRPLSSTSGVPVM